LEDIMEEQNTGRELDDTEVKVLESSEEEK
jgi:hypothetical protein